MVTVRFLFCLFCVVVAGRGWVFGCGVVTGRPFYSKEDNQYDRIIKIAEKEVGVRETGCGNCGGRVEAYLKRVGLGAGSPWCAAFVSWVFSEAGLRAPRTAWSPALFPESRKVPGSSALRPGLVFGLYYPSVGRIAHCGIVTGLRGDWIVTVEGNTSVSGTREGDGVYKKLRHRRTVAKFADWIAADF
jgi:hypothetical protein